MSEGLCVPKYTDRLIGKIVGTVCKGSLEQHRKEERQEGRLSLKKEFLRKKNTTTWLYPARPLPGLPDTS